MKNKIPFVDLKAQYKEIKADIDKSIKTVLQNTNFINGNEVEEFENNFAKYIGVKYAVGVNSGTDALILGVRALDIKDGEVLVPANSYISSALAASENGLIPVFVDVDENDYGMDLEDLKKKINTKTKAIVVVHLYGLPDKLDEILKIIKSAKQKIFLIEDACQAHGATFKNKKVGSFGDFAAFSFYPGKNLGAYGDGGMITTNSKKINEKLKLLRQYGQIKKYYHESLGINSRLDTIQAAILNTKLKNLDKWNKNRDKIAKYYTEIIKKELPFIITPKEFDDRQSSWHIYCIRVPKRDELLDFLHSRNIEALIHYPVPIHRQHAYNYLNYKKGSLPKVENITTEIISLPLYPQITKLTVDEIVDCIKKFYK